MSYTHLTSQERHVIYHLILYGLSFHEIGRRLGRSHSTIQREVQRNQIPNIKSIYTSERGTHRYRTFKHRAQHQRRKAHPPLWQYVVEKLGLHWSPEQIVGRLKKDFPRSKAMSYGDSNRNYYSLQLILESLEYSSFGYFHRNSLT